MKERPILFSAPMVRALLDGSKTQTRRAVKITHRTPGLAACLLPPVGAPRPLVAAELCPHGQPGDRLWVRETWAHDAQSLEQCRASHEDLMGGMNHYGPYYRATEVAPDTLNWKSSIHMPRWASRITLEINNVRVERLKDISEADARAEGAIPSDGYAGLEEDRRKGWVDAYRQIWETINGPGSWAATPWVWVIEFKRLKP